ncbi:MAG: FAD-dependent oxidoreductase [Hyphomicrobiaceae bacterium]|nr:FAD-dependent oxidoreductase [Hyphomicrobiaceae bacterium]
MKGSRRRAIVVGAGIVGVCSAIELNRRGWSVTLVDRLQPGEGCSFGNAGILAAQAVVPVAMPGIAREVPGMLVDRDSPLVVRLRSLPSIAPWLLHFWKAADAARLPAAADAMKALYGTSLELHEALSRQAGVPELVKPTRYLYIARDKSKLDVEGLSWRLRRERGAEIEVLDGPVLHESEPSLSRDYQRGVRLGPIGYTANPFRLTQAYATLFQREGGQFVRAEVRALRPAGAVTGLETSAGQMAAETVIIAAGSWSLALARPLGLKLPLIAERGYHVTYADPGITLNHVLSEAERHFAVTSMEMGLRVAGTEELGLADDPPSWRRAHVLERQARALFPGARLDKPSRWMGPRPGTPDSLPAIGALPGHPTIFIAAGHGHLGLTGGPNTGRIVAALASGERLNMDLAPYAPGRYQPAVPVGEVALLTSPHR